MEGTKVLIPEVQEIRVGVKTYHVGGLSLKQTILLGRFMANMLIRKQEQLSKLQKKFSGDGSNVDDVMSILDILEQEEIYKLFSIILNEDDLQYIEDNFDLTRSLEIIAIICEQNDFGQVKKNVLRIMAAVMPKEKPTH